MTVVINFRLSEALRLVGCMSITLVLASCFSMSSPEALPRSNSNDEIYSNTNTLKISEAQDLFLNGYWAEAAMAFEKIAEAGSREDSLQALYWLGKCKFKTEGPAVARPIFAQVINEYPDEQTRALAMLNMADCDFVESRFESAAERYIELSHSCSTLVREDELLYKIGLCYVHLKRTSDAVRFFEALVERYPKGDFTADAKAHLRTMPSSKIRPILTTRSQSVYVQAGLFSEKTRATAIRAKLQNAGFISSLVNVTRKGKHITLVTVGMPRTRAEAEAIASRASLRGFEAIVKP